MRNFDLLDIVTAVVSEEQNNLCCVGLIDTKMWVTSLINFCFDQHEQEISKLKSCHSEKDDLQRQLLEMKQQVSQLQEEKALIEQKASTLTTEPSQRIAELESENATLQSEKQSLQEDHQLLQGQFIDCVKEKESMHK